MKFESLVDILKTNSPTFELTLTTIASSLETNTIILNADDKPCILFLNKNFNMALTFLLLNAMVKGIFYKRLQHQFRQD